MTLPVRHLPVLQNWDCRGCGQCCYEYHVEITEEERQRILSQGWEREPGFENVPLFLKMGPWWSRRYELNHRANGACVFLSEQGRCRIHERFGTEAKPLPCRLFPFILVPTGAHWRVGLRFSCPSAAASRGRALDQHNDDLKQYAAALERLAGFDLAAVPAPALQAGQRVGWHELFHFVKAMLGLIGNRQHRLEHRLRQLLALANLCSQARFEKVQGKRLEEFLGVLMDALAAEAPEDPARLAAPTWIGRLLFRQALAIYARKDQGPDRGLVSQGRVALVLAAWRFARGKGAVPRVHAQLPDTTFERVEQTGPRLTEAAEQILERYYTIKIGSLQFCGPINFDMPFWEGLRSLLLTFPVIGWLTQAWSDLSPEEAVLRAVGVVDNNFGYNRLLGMRRQRLSLRVLAGRGELERLIARYGR